MCQSATRFYRDFQFQLSKSKETQLAPLVVGGPPVDPGNWQLYVIIYNH